MNEQTEFLLIHWLEQINSSLQEMNANANRRHRELLDQQKEQFDRDQYTQGMLASFGGDI